MAEEPKEQNTPLTLEGFWKLLDNKLVSLGTPAALVAVALDFARKSQWREAGFCVVGAIGLWIIIQVANKLAPKIDKLLDWILNNTEILLLNGWAKLTSDFEGKYYERLKFDCREYEIRGINRESLELKNLFVPLRMAQKSAREMSQNLIQNTSIDPLKQQQIGQLLVLMTGEIKQRLVILGAPGSGKSTLLRHITLMYATRRQRRLHRQVPKLIPVFLQLRYIYQDIIDNQDSESSLVKIIEKAVQKLQPSDPLKPRDRWFARRLRQGKCLIMLDGLDEIADDLQRQQVSQWVSKQITEYSNTPFIITSRPEAYKKAPLQGNVLELEVQPFSREQRNKFIQDWYLCLKKKNQKVDLGIKDKAIQAANDLIAQIDASISLKLMARNPLLLNMIVITHNWNVTLSTRRVDLYEEMCRVLLEDPSNSEVETIDNSYVTWAEYQLFLNETTNSHYTPANKRQVQESITNISFWDANRFCAWLSLRSRQELGEPGICYRPATEQEDQQNNDGKIKLVRFQVPALYAQLAYYLAAGMWKEADEETGRLMLQVAGREKQGYLSPDDIKQFPCEDLRTIDQLWVKYSDGHFGFSVQKEIYLSVGRILEGNQTRSPIVNKIFVPFKWIYARFGGRDRDDYDKLYLS